MAGGNGGGLTGDKHSADDRDARDVHALAVSPGVGEGCQQEQFSHGERF
jgi:hypothetical protein